MMTRRGWVAIGATWVACAGVGWIIGQVWPEASGVEPGLVECATEYESTNCVYVQGERAWHVDAEGDATELSACVEEDSDNCVWNAAERGNGEGTSFVAWHGELLYLGGAR